VSTLYNTETITERRGTPAAIYLRVEIASPIDSLDFLLVRKETIRLMRLVKNSNSDI
jgi:hypothetical protein